jgi:hypothetical protein
VINNDDDGNEEETKLSARAKKTRQKDGKFEDDVFYCWLLLGLGLGEVRKEAEWRHKLRQQRQPRVSETSHITALLQPKVLRFTDHGGSLYAAPSCHIHIVTNYPALIWSLEFVACQLAIP